MRSIAHGESEKIENQVVTVSILGVEDCDGEALDPPDPSPSIEENIINEEINEESAAIVHDRILSLFQDRTPERDMVEGIIDGWSADELRELLNLDKTAYNSMRRLVRRRINKAHPEGWSHVQR